MKAERFSFRPFVPHQITRYRPGSPDKSREHASPTTKGRWGSNDSRRDRGERIGHWDKRPSNNVPLRWDAVSSRPWLLHACSRFAKKKTLGIHPAVNEVLQKMSVQAGKLARNAGTALARASLKRFRKGIISKTFFSSVPSIYWCIRFLIQSTVISALKKTLFYCLRN